MPKLRDDFPGRIQLEAAGITDTKRLTGKTREELTAIDGIGDVMADKILAARDETEGQNDDTENSGGETVTAAPSAPAPPTDPLTDSVQTNPAPAPPMKTVTGKNGTVTATF